MESLRLFIAIELNNSLKKEIQKIQNQLKKIGNPITWVKPKNIHITLKFLGDTPEEKIDSILKIMAKAAGLSSVFTFNLNTLGAFPNPENPEIIWMDIEKGYDRIKNIVLILNEELEKIGFKKETREFSAHVTLGRLRSSDNRLPLSKAISDFKMSKDFEQTVKEITLVQSTLTRQGPTYEILGIAPLAKS